jgi:serine protease Do
MDMQRASLITWSLCLTITTAFLPTLLAQDLPLRPTVTSLPLARRSPIVDVVEKVKGAVVNIHSERMVSKLNTEEFNVLARTQHRVNGMGTGIIIDPRGYIVTNHHVVDDVQALRVRLSDGGTYPARVISRDAENDLAIMKIDVPRSLPIVPLGTASDLSVGETVIAIGNAFGYEHTVSCGIISALKRDVSLNKDVSYKSLIQTDAAINPGNSGGPLLNANGELIGVNVAIRAGAQGIGFAIPVDSMLKTTSEMISFKKRTGMNHGMVVRDVVKTEGGTLKRYAVVDQVAADSIAAKAGVKVGDVIEKIGDIGVVCALDVERGFIDRMGGDKVTFSTRRGANDRGEAGQVVAAELTLQPLNRLVSTAAPSPAAATADPIWKKLGVKFQPVPPSTVAPVNPQLRGGLMIIEVNAESLAAKSGFQVGDILIGLHQWETITIDNVLFVVNHQDLATFSPLRFYLIRAGQLRRGWFTTIE